MSLMTWDNRYSVKVRERDNHHKKIINAINELHNAMTDGKGKEVLEKTLGNLTSYASYHFSSEEKEMEKHKYPDYEVHRGKHQAMTAKAHSFIEDYKQGKVSLSHEVSDFLSDWLNKHIVGTDQQYSNFMNGVGVN